MAASYIDTDVIDAYVGADVRADLFVDDTGGTLITTLIEHASEIVRASAHNAGYTSLGNTTTNVQVILATLGQFLFAAYNRKQQELPERFAVWANHADAIASGALPLVGLTVDDTAAVGGSKWSSTLSTATRSYHQRLSIHKLSGY